MSSPRHSPPPSAAAPKPKGILKNAGERRPSQGAPPDHLQWDESNLTLHEIQREQQEARMKIDEPKTPFVHGTNLAPVGDEDNFDLDGQNFFGSAGPSTPSSTARRGSAAELLAANTSANAGRANSEVSPAVGLDELDSSRASNSSRSTSRSPSFSLPKSSSRRSSSRSATGETDQRDGIRQEMEERNMDVDVDDDGMVEEEEPDPETQAKHAEFAAKRNRHYGNEAEAMKIAAALAAQEDDEDEEDDSEQQPAAIPPVPPLPNGSRK